MKLLINNITSKTYAKSDVRTKNQGYKQQTPTSMARIRVKKYSKGLVHKVAKEPLVQALVSDINTIYDLQIEMLPDKGDFPDTCEMLSPDVLLSKVIPKITEVVVRPEHQQKVPIVVTNFTCGTAAELFYIRANFEKNGCVNYYLNLNITSF
jgi:hypothetical protein